jgi:hypothetical protein
MDLVLTSHFDFVLSEARLTSALLLHEMVYITGAADRSDHLPTGMINTSIRLTPYELWVQITDDFGRSAPHALPFRPVVTSVQRSLPTESSIALRNNTQWTATLRS